MTQEKETKEGSEKVKIRKENKKELGKVIE